MTSLCNLALKFARSAADVYSDLTVALLKTI